MTNDFLERRILVKPRWLLYATMLLLGAFLVTYSVHHNRIKRLNEVREAREISAVEAKKQVEILQQKLVFYQSDEFVIKAAKERYGYLLKNEKRYMFEGAKAPEYIAPSIPVEFVPMETQESEGTILP